MKPISLQQFYNLGTLLQPLNNVAEGQLLSDIVWTLVSARFQLSEHVSAESVLPSSSKRAAQSLISAIGLIAPEKFEDIAKIDNTRLIGNYEHYNLSSSLATFNTVLASDFPEIATYYVEKKGTHNTDDLINHAEDMFSEDLRKRLPKDAITDLRNAGACVAFDLHTAAGFHFLRAVESVLRAYCTVVAKKVPKSRNWGAWIEVLRTHNVDESITGMLDHIRAIYRNKIIHPELVLDTDDAIVLMGVTQSAILMMMKDMEKREPSAAQTILPLKQVAAAIGLRGLSTPKLAEGTNDDTSTKKLKG